MPLLGPPRPAPLAQTEKCGGRRGGATVKNNGAVAVARKKWRQFAPFPHHFRTKCCKEILENYYFFDDNKKLFCLSCRFPSLYIEFFLHYYTIILQRIRIIVGDAGFDLGPLPALPMSHHISIKNT